MTAPTLRDLPPGTQVLRVDDGLYPHDEVDVGVVLDPTPVDIERAHESECGFDDDQPEGRGFVLVRWSPDEGPDTRFNRTWERSDELRLATPEALTQPRAQMAPLPTSWEPW